jgi:hypothetical protein
MPNCFAYSAFNRCQPIHGIRANDASDRNSAEQVIQNIETNVSPGSTHCDKAVAVHEYLQAHPLTKIGPAAKDLKLSIPTVTGALETLTKLKIAKESTGKRRDRLFAYPRYLHILSEGTEPLRT